MRLAVSEDTAIIFIKKILIALYWVKTQLHAVLMHYNGYLLSLPPCLTATNTHSYVFA